MYLITMFATAVGVLAVTAAAGASDSNFRRQVQARSAESALGAMQVRRFSARGSGTNDVIRDRLIASLGLKVTELKTVSPDESAEGSTMIASGGDFMLEVSHAGTRGQFRRRSALSTPADAKLRLPTVSDLEDRARTDIRQVLGGLIPSANGDALKAWKVAHEMVGDIGADGGEPQSELAASTIVFVRMIDGIPVLSGTSMVHVTYAPNRELVGLKFEWPELTPIDEQATVAVGEVKRRVQSLQRLRQGRLTEGAIECGYYARETDAEVVLEPACVSTYRVERGGHATAYSDVVPISPQLRADVRWPEAGTLHALESGVEVGR